MFMMMFDCVIHAKKVLFARMVSMMMGFFALS